MNTRLRGILLSGMCAAFAIIPGQSALASTLPTIGDPAQAQIATPVTTEINPEYLPYMVDIDNTTWLDANTGEPISRERMIELESARISAKLAKAKASSVEPDGTELGSRRTWVDCTSTNYKVQFTQIYQPGTVEACFIDHGYTDIPVAQQTIIENVLGVCPGAHEGQIYYYANVSWHWSTWRGPYPNNSTCFYFADTGVYPTTFSQVWLEY